MPVFEWKPTYGVGVKRCDEDHQKLFGLIRELRSAIRSGKAAPIPEKIVEELESYSIYHFTAEEALLAESNYPALEAHRAEHQQFIDTVVNFRKQGIAAQSYEVLNFINQWLVHHIKHTDQQYSAHLNAHGIS